MTKINGFRNILAESGVILFFIVLTYVYMFPLIEGKDIEMDDIQHFKGMSKELSDYREATGEEALWTNSMFGGMPAYLISVQYPGNLARHVQTNIRNIFGTASFMILYLVGFYILLRSLKFSRWLGIAGAVAFGFSSYFIIIIGAGHTSKAVAIAYLAPMIAGILLAFRRKYLAGTLLFTISFSFELLAGHLQITYYGFLLVALLGVVELIYAIKDNTLPAFFKSMLYLVAGLVIALGMNFSRLYTTWDYSKRTIRGASELSTNDANRTSGLDKDYVVQWSYGIDETFTLLIPNFKGGGSQINPGINSESFKTLQANRVQNPRQMIQAVSMYHGDQPGTSGPVYVGAIIVFLFVLGLFVVEGVYKWWLLSATLVSIVLSWGGNIMWLTSFLLDYLPFYNKFRAPSMTLVIAELAMPLLGFLALNNLLSGKVKKDEILKSLKYAFVITGGLALLFVILPGLAGNFTNAADTMRYPDWLIESMISDRQSMLRSDAFRSFFFIALSAGALYLWHIGKLQTRYFILATGLLILIDLWTVDKRYLNNDHFISSRQIDDPFPVTAADQAIMQDDDLYYRVLPLPNPFQDARASYFHKNVGGYHAAKLRRYQEIIDHHLQPELQQMVNGLQNGTSPDSVFLDLPVMNMLNTRYVIYDLNQAPLHNPHSLGNAWFVDDMKIIGTADDEIAAMKGFDPSQTAVIHKQFLDQIQSGTFVKDSTGSIRLTEYQPNYLKYAFFANNEQLTLFSDIYYEDGWNAYVDGVRVPHFRANYILRAMVIPAGKHTIEFRFEPEAYYTGNKVSLASSLLLILAIGGYFVYSGRRRKNRTD